MLSHPHLFLSPNAFFQRAFKTHSDPLQGVWEFTICNFEVRAKTRKYGAGMYKECGLFPSTHLPGAGRLPSPRPYI